MTMTVGGTSGLVFPDSSTQNTAAKTGMVNRIINGAMMIDQRNAGASVTPASSAFTYTQDRWCFYVSQASKLTSQQSTTAPVGFVNSLKVTSSSAYSIGSGDVFCLFQNIEGFNTSDFSWGTANAKPVTLSFWVQSSLTGTFGGSVKNGGSSRSYPFSYTISAANTWEQKTITILGDTSGTWATDNSTGVGVLFGLGVGSSTSGTAGTWASANYASATGATSVVGTNGATFYITGVQLEKGSTATPFEVRPYGTELALCQRYYWMAQNSQGYFAQGYMYNNNTLYFGVKLPVSMRAAPTVASSTGTGQFGFFGNNAADYFNSMTLSTASTNFIQLYNNTEISGATNATGGIYVDVVGAYAAFTAEL